MSIGGSFRELGRFLDACEREDRAVDDVRLVEDRNPTGAPTLSADVALRIEPEPGDERGLETLCSPKMDEDGTLRFALDSTRSVVPLADYDVDVEVERAAVDSGGAIAVDLRARVETADVEASTDVGTDAAGDAAVDATTVDGTGVSDEGSSTPVGRDRDVPPFKDPDLLAEVYETHDTFAAMADAIDMDVTAETVRRYMIDYDIHEPNSYRTGGDGDADEGQDDGAGRDVADGRDGGAAVDEEDTDDASTDDASGPKPETPVVTAAEAAASDTVEATETPPEPVVISDGIGLPEDVTVETLIDTVKRSNTLYEVTREVGVDRQDALEMLEELNLIDLVVGRLATEVERDISREDVIERLREAPATQ